MPKIWEPAPVKAKEPTEQILDISPNYDYDKPNKLTFQYHEPLRGLSPTHTPDKVTHPERWRFYDFDLDVVREEVAKDISFARNLSLEEFRGKEEFFNMLVEHNRRQEKRPPVGLYSPRDPFDKPIEVDFSKARGRFEADLGLDEDREGDVLVLSPRRPEKKLADIIFDKQTWRPELKTDEMQDELILEPNLEVVRKKQAYLVTDFGKQLGRDS